MPERLMTGLKRKSPAKRPEQCESLDFASELMRMHAGVNRRTASIRPRRAYVGATE